MVIIYYSSNRIVSVISDKGQIVPLSKKATIAEALMQLAQQFPDSLLIWCHQSLKDQLAISEIETLFHHKKLLLSYNPSDVSFIDSAIGYVDASPFIQITKAVPFPTWQMSSTVGCVHSEVVLALQNEIPLDTNFDYFLCSLGKLLMPKGLLCYSEPRLLKQKVKVAPIQTSRFILFRFVKQHYRTRWVFLLLFNLMLYERQFPVLPFLFSFFYKNRSKANISLDAIQVQTSNKMVELGTVDVIIPTIGRKDYLFDVLKDLKAQTHLPTNVIIVEQNPEEVCESELDYLTTEEWPFDIKHTFTHQAGACNARNIALAQITSEWVFFADDDIRIDTDFIQKTLEKVACFGAKAVTLRCFQTGEKKTYCTVFQWVTFGSGCSIVFAASLKKSNFNMGYEFGFGEDGDFGLQLRHQGHDVLYLPEPEILHLKAPIGGFRTTPVLQWQNDEIQPKPSPTIMLYQLLHNTPTQTNGYKTTLFFKYYGLQKIKNPIRYYLHFQKQWERSVFWANELKRQNER